MTFYLGQKVARPAIALAAGLVITAGTHGDLMTTWSAGPGLDIVVPDDGYDGSFGSMASNTILVDDLEGNDFVTDLNVRVGLNHSFIGDLTIKLMGPDGTVVTLVNRPGFVDGPDDGTGVGGDSSNFSILYPILYDDEAESGEIAEMMGLGIGGSAIVGDPANGSPDNYVPFSDGAGPAALSNFDGTNALGEWTLYIGDSAGGAEGLFDFWEIQLTTVPAPGALALLGVAGLLARRRRRG